MSNVLDSFFLSLGFEINTDKIEEFKKKAAELRESVLKVGAIASGAAIGIGAFVLKVAEGMDATNDFSNIVGMSAREVDALGKVAQMNDSSLEAMKSTLEGLSSMIGQASLGVGRGAKIFEKLGFKAKDAEGNVKDVTTVLGEVSEKFEGMNAAKKISMAGRLGIDKSLINLLSKGKEGFMELRDAALAANPLTNEQYKQADRITTAWDKAKMAVGMYSKLLGAKLFPLLESVLDRYNQWMKDGKKSTNDAVATGLTLICNALESLWDWLLRVVVAVKSAYNWLTQFKVVMWAAGAAVGMLIAYKVGVFFINLGSAIFTAARALMAFNAAAALPVILIGGIVLAIAFLVDELVNFYEGNDSIIGQLNDEYPGAIYGAWGLLALLGGGFIALKWKAISSMLETMAIMGLYALDYLKLAGKAAISFASLAWGWISTASTAIASGARMALAWIIGMGPIAWVIAAVIAAVALIWYYWDELSEWLGTAWNNAMQAVKDGVKTAIDWVIGIFNTAKDKVMGFIDSVVGAISKVGQLLGLTEDASKVKIAVSSAPGLASADTSANNSFNATGGVIGRAGSNVNNAVSSTQTTTITAPITVNSSDPAKAGEAVKAELDRLNRQAVRNGQSAVTL